MSPEKLKALAAQASMPRGVAARIESQDLNELMEEREALLAACQAAHFWLSAEAESDEPGSTTPDEILCVLAGAILKVGGES